MALEVLSKTVNDIVVFELSGSLDTNTAPEAEAKINDQLAAGIKKIVINLVSTKYVSSAGLRVFLATAKKITAIGGAVKLCAPNEIVQEILDISGFSSILDVRATEEDALKDI